MGRFIMQLDDNHNVATKWLQFNWNDTMAEASKFEVNGHEMLEKVVKKSGNSGRIYLPPYWIGKRVKIIRIDE